MKRLLVILSLCWLSGCAHRAAVCGTALFTFVEGGVWSYEVNLRDDRLLKTDVILSGQIKEWNPLWKATPHVTTNPLLDVRTKLAVVELAVVRGVSGTSSYSRIVIFSARDFEGRVQLPAVELGGQRPEARFVLSFEQNGQSLIRDVEVESLFQKEVAPAPALDAANIRP